MSDADRCGAPTSDGGRCQNPTESCPYHDADDADGPDVETAREELEDALDQLDRSGGAHREAFVRGHVEAALEALDA